MIDDIISYGGSMYYSALALKVRRKNIYAFASHVENSILEGNLIESGLVSRIYTTKSLFTGNHSLISVIQL